ncbi:MAG: hypothetical protein J6E29_03705 [Prevotella sp.]|nr:hypothetical protein [Prevotella sp.]
MNRVLLILCFLCIPWVARGQSAYNWTYWFDTDDGHQHAGMAQDDSFTISAVVDGLDEGLHAFNVQVADTAGKYSPPYTRLFFRTKDRTVNTLRYWFDNDAEHIVSIPITTGATSIDVSQIEPGVHFIYCQAGDRTGMTTDVVTRCFYRQATAQATQWAYWFDDDQDAKHTVQLSGEVAMIDVSELADGIHTIHSQLIGQSPSLVASRMFIKIPQTENIGSMTCICTIDKKLVAQAEVPASGGVISWQMDVDSLDVGLHHAVFQAITPSGAASTIVERFFMRVISNKEMGKMKCVYSLDNQQTYAQSGTMSADGRFHFDLDVSSMEDGLHRLAYMMVSEEGVTTPQKTAFFWKAPMGGYGIVGYWYWLNEQSDGQAHKVTLQDRQDPFSLITLLPVESQPIRSSQFQFRVVEDKPVIYAKNDIHLRFYDVSGRFTDATKQFVDESVKQEVTEVTPVNNGDHKTIQTPGKNEIRWFKFYAEEGDTVAFRTDQAASIQVFSPEAKEVYSASGSTSVVYGGCHTWTDGTYYVAVHDVTGSKPNISLDFTHLAKYDVVDYDIALVGNGGCSTITFRGNGFRDLYAVDFINEANDTVHAFNIGHESDGMTSITADFTDIATGKYTALFHFTEGKKYVYDAITVEDAKPIDLATEVTFPRSFGHVVTYTCKITNKGNMTAYAVPIYTWLKSKKLNGIYHIDYDGLDLAGLFDGVVSDSITAEDAAQLKAYSEAAGDDHHFLKFWAEDEDHPRDSVFVRSNYFFTNIAPNETKVLRLTISTREVDTYAYFTVPEDWPSYQVAQVEGVAGARAKFRAPSMKDRYCCIRNKVECVANLVADGTSIANEILQYAPDLTTQMAAAAADCVASGASKIISTAGTVMCDDNSVEKNFWDKVHAALDGTSTTGMITSCISKLPLPWKKIKAIFDAIGKGAGGASMTFGLGVDMADCAIAFTSKIPGCPPIPPGGGGAQGGKSHDPNEIYGYLAESGSKYMTDEVEKVNYRIEFENDTAFATRSAMVVEIRDTLDSKLFDLSSYAPTGIKIGEKVEYLDGEPNFVRTIDMRPEINGLVEVEGKYDAKKGVMTWLFTSIDPMTMEPTNDPMDGFLPVNTNGQGIGEMSYDIKLKQKMVEGTNIQNRASIVFDINEPILTPTWTNIVDATAPESHVTDVQMLNDSTASVSIEASDELSGPWRYDVYVQYGSGAWFKAAENVPVDTTASVKVYEGIDHGFYVVVTDSAGNVEQKEAEREFTFEVFGSQMDTDTQIELAQGWNWISHNQQEPLPVSALKPAGSRMVGQVEELIEDSRLGWMGDLEELQPTQMYKLQMDQPLTVQLSGRLFNAGFRSIPLYEGWNWMGYPVANTMTPTEALSKLEAEEGDMLIGQDGMATYNDGQWQGTLMAMNPGQGYMYRSASDKNLFLNATAQASSRRNVARRSMSDVQYPDGWTVDKRKYPNVMGMIGQLWNGSMQEDVSGWVLAAFCGDECRGIGQTVGDVLMMNVYGNGGEQIGFRVMNVETGEVLGVSSQEAFRPEVLGTMAQPYELHIGDPSGMQTIAMPSRATVVYDLMGRRLQPSTPLGKGVYVVTDAEKRTAQKVIRK